VAGARSLAAITEWAADAPPLVLAALGVRRDPLTGQHRVPGETTLRRVLTTIDGDALDAAVTAWLADRLPAPGPRPRRGCQASACRACFGPTPSPPCSGQLP
jgi:hypothetical protein